MRSENDFDNPLRQQCWSLPSLCTDQISGIRQGLEEGVPNKILKKIQRVVVTGCGDSYMAAMAAIPAFQKFAERFGNDFSYIKAIEAARFLSFDRIKGEQTLIVGVSCSGGAARVREVLKRANHYGCISLALTSDSGSPVAQEAEYRLITHTPEFPNANPGLRNYYASLTGLYMLAAKLGEESKCYSEGAIDKMTQAIEKNTAAWDPELKRIDSQMLNIAKKWKDFVSYDYIGDHIQLSSALFMAAKMVEVTGKRVSTDDAENWCHVGFFQKEPENIGTVIVADRKANDKSRINETLHQAKGIRRPILLIANGDKRHFHFGEQVELCQVPDAPEGFEFLLAMMNFIPGAILAGYISAMIGEPYFRDGIWAEPGNNSIRSSHIQII